MVVCSYEMLEMLLIVIVMGCNFISKRDIACLQINVFSSSLC